LKALLVLGQGQSLARQFPQFPIQLVQLQFAITDIQRLLLPLIQLFGKPDRMLIRPQDQEAIRRRVPSRAIGKVIDGPCTQLDPLRLDAPIHRAESCWTMQAGLGRP
ncbi:MAG: hypothetical protein ACK56I_08560, partial [bacterium]